MNVPLIESNQDTHPCFPPGTCWCLEYDFLVLKLAFCMPHVKLQWWLYEFWIPNIYQEAIASNPEYLALAWHERCHFASLTSSSACNETSWPILITELPGIVVRWMTVPCLGQTKSGRACLYRRVFLMLSDLPTSFKTTCNWNSRQKQLVLSYLSPIFDCDFCMMLNPSEGFFLDAFCHVKTQKMFTYIWAQPVWMCRNLLQ